MARAVCARALSLAGCLLGLGCIAAPAALAATPTNPFAPFPLSRALMPALEPFGGLLPLVS